MLTGTGKETVTKIGGLSAALLILLAVFFLARMTSLRREEDFKWEQNRYGFSLSGIELTILASRKEPAFRDPWYAYLVSAKGNLKGSVLDPALMEEGISRPINEVINAYKLDSFFAPVSDGTYYSRTLTPLGEGSRRRLYIIYDPAEERYCLIEANGTDAFQSRTDGGRSI